MRRILTRTLLFLLVTQLVACAPIPTPTPDPCPWNWAYPDTPDLDAELNQKLVNAGMVGTVKTHSVGEIGGDDCSYHEAYISVDVSLEVADLNDLQTLTKMVDDVEQILNNASSRLSLKDTISILTFKDKERECRWDFKENTCH